MRILDLSWRRYRVSFRSPFRTAHGQTTHREGLILKLVDDDGLVGLGEAAPLAEFGGGDIERAERLLASLVPELMKLDSADAEQRLASLLPDAPNTSAVRFALETALLDLQAQRADMRIADLLSSDVRDSIPVNATVGQAVDTLAIEAARDAVSHGFRTVKLKIAIGDSLQSEVDRVAAVRAAIGPETRLRLDANGAWTVPQAIEMINALARFDIELIEQPVAPADRVGLAKVRHEVGVPIAADEAVLGLESARRVIDAGAADVLVVKPMACGGLHAGRRIIELAHASGLRCIVTSSLECGIGVAASLHVAATLPFDSPACGLATLDLLEDDLIVEPLDIVDGRIALPDRLGLGVRDDEEAMGRHANFRNGHQSSSGP